MKNYTITVNGVAYDIIVIARTSAKGKSYHEIERALLHLGKLHKCFID